MIPETLILTTQYECKARYRKIRDDPLDRRRSYTLAKMMRKKHGWRAKVKMFDGEYYIYINTEK